MHLHLPSHPYLPYLLTLGFCLFGLHFLWPILFNMAGVLPIRVGNLELPLEPGWLQGRSLFLLSMGPGSSDPWVSTETPALLWPSVVWHTCSSLVEIGQGSLSTTCHFSMTWVELCNGSDWHPVWRSQALPGCSFFWFGPLYFPLQGSGPALCLHRPPPRGNEINLQGSG